MKKQRIVGMLLCLLFAANAAQAGLVAWWPLDEGTGQTVGDASGNGNSGFLGATTGTDTTDPAWLFDATLGRYVLDWVADDVTEQYVNLDARVGNFAGLTEGTIMAWIKVEQVNVNDVDVILAASDLSDNGSDLRFHCNYRTNGTTTQNTNSFNFMVRDLSTAEPGEIRSVAPETPYVVGGPAVWHHVAVTYTDSANGTDNGVVRMYLDGSEISQYRDNITTSIGFFDAVKDLDSMSLGRSVRYNGGLQPLWFYDGAMSDVAVLDVVLSEDTIGAIVGGAGHLGYSVIDGTPANGMTQVPLTGTTLTWTAPPMASGATYNVFIGTDTDLSDNFVGSTTATSFIPTLAAGQTYYWQIETVTVSDSYVGEMFSFTTQGGVTNPYPWDGMVGADPATQPLSWEGDATTASYDVYFGPAGSISFQGNTTATTWDATGLSEDTAYEWRIDTRNASNQLLAVGDVVGFTTGALEAHWKMDEGTGTSVTDSVGGNTGTAVDDAWDDGVVPVDGSTFGSSMVFDGVDNAILIPGNDGLEGLPAITVTAWVRVGEFQNDDRVMEYDDQWYLLAEEGYFAFTIHGVSSAYSNPAETLTVDPNTWYHVAGVSDGQTMKIYLNGELQDTQLSIPIQASSDFGMTIGARNNASAGTANFLNGWVDDVRMYSAALSADSIMAIYENNSVAYNPSPAHDPDFANPQPITTDLAWSKGVSVNGQDVYLVKIDPLYGADPNFNEPAALVHSATDVTGVSVSVPDLDYDSFYGWRVDSKDSSGGVITGDVWVFSTIPTKAYNPTPAFGATVDAVNPPDLAWSQGGAGTYSYDVFFGTTSGGLSQIADDIAVETFAMPALVYDATYYWRVDQVQGGTTYTGDEWTFSTITPTCDPVPVGDISGPAGVPDCVVDLYDFAQLAANWLTCNLTPVEACP